MLLSEKDLDFWIENDLNVLFKGKHGIGKTAQVMQAFKKHKLKWKYFSAATLDPWVDFVGIPKEKTDANNRTYVDFVRPKDIEYDEVEAIFFDEYNRAPKKVLNAVMELIQFKTINGRPLKNLRFIWAAINENSDEEDTYSVEKIDPAQLDRFQVHIELPYQVDRTYFKQKYSKDAAAAIEWWNDLPEKARDKVSPRRLDYALEVWQKGGNISFVIPKDCNPSDLLKRLAAGAFRERFVELAKETSDEAWKKAFEDPNFATWMYDQLDSKKLEKHRIQVFLHLHEDMLSKYISKHHKKADVMAEVYAMERGKAIIENIIKAGVAKKGVLKSLKSLIPTDLNTLLKHPQYLQIHKMLDTTNKRQSAWDNMQARFHLRGSGIYGLSENGAPLTESDILYYAQMAHVVQRRSRSWNFDSTMFKSLAKDIEKMSFSYGFRDSENMQLAEKYLNDISK